MTSACLENVDQAHISHKKYQSYLSNRFRIFQKNDDTATGIDAFICASPHYFIIDNCLIYIYMDALHKPAIYLKFTDLVDDDPSSLSLRIKEAARISVMLSALK